MDGTTILIILLVVAVIVGPFAALRGLSYYRAKKGTVLRKDKDDEDDQSGFF